MLLWSSALTSTRLMTKLEQQRMIKYGQECRTTRAFQSRKVSGQVPTYADYCTNQGEDSHNRVAAGLQTEHVLDTDYLPSTNFSLRSDWQLQPSNYEPAIMAAQPSQQLSRASLLSKPEELWAMARPDLQHSFTHLPCNYLVGSTSILSLSILNKLSR